MHKMEGYRSLLLGLELGKMSCFSVIAQELHAKNKLKPDTELDGSHFKANTSTPFLLTN